MSIKSKIVCAVPSASDPRNLTLCGRRRATGKGKGCVLSSAKISLLFRTAVIFDEKCFYFSILRMEKQKHGDFFSIFPLFLSSPSSFSFPSLLASHIRRRPSAGAPSRMTHARGDAHPRLAHSASFPFFAFTPHLQSAEQLLVRGEGFCISTISPEGEGTSPKASPTKRCCSIICAHRVKR